MVFEVDRKKARNHGWRHVEVLLNDTLARVDAVERQCANLAKPRPPVSLDVIAAYQDCCKAYAQHCQEIEAAIAQLQVELKIRMANIEGQLRAITDGYA